MPPKTPPLVFDGDEPLKEFVRDWAASKDLTVSQVLRSLVRDMRAANPTFKKSK